jgi:hypothetical protein
MHHPFWENALEIPLEKFIEGGSKLAPKPRQEAAVPPLYSDAEGSLLIEDSVELRRRSVDGFGETPTRPQMPALVQSSVHMSERLMCEAAEFAGLEFCRGALDEFGNPKDVREEGLKWAAAQCLEVCRPEALSRPCRIGFDEPVEAQIRGLEGLDRGKVVESPTKEFGV